MSCSVQSAPSSPNGGSGRELVLIIAIAFSVPLVLRPISHALTAGPPPRYAPSLEAARPRRPFNPAPREEFRRIAPQYVSIGDFHSGRASIRHT